MTIALDYTDLQYDDDATVLHAEEGDFHYELLLAATIFRVGEADFSIEHEKVPLLDFSFVLRTTVVALADGSVEMYESPLSWISITLARTGETVALSANFTEATASVALSELQAAATGFHARVMQDLLIRYPRLPDNPQAQKFLVPADG